MNVADLRPRPLSSQPFGRDKARYVPATSGCYALVTLDGTVIYVGLATNLRSRMVDHLDTPEKRAVTALGRAATFHWLETDDREAVERGWLNSHQALTGGWPILNKAASPLAR